MANHSLRWISLFTLGLLSLVLSVPAVSQLFAFALPAPQLLLAATGFVMAGLLWFELVKRVLGRSRPDGPAFTAGHESD
jgi:uncharacterized membrane protein